MGPGVPRDLENAHFFFFSEGGNMFDNKKPFVVESYISDRGLDYFVVRDTRNDSVLCTICEEGGEASRVISSRGTAEAFCSLLNAGVYPRVQAS